MIDLQKYSDVKGRFEGKFLVAAFEAIAIGLGKNIEYWNAIDYNDDVKALLISKVKEIWADGSFQSRYGSGVNVTSRVPTLIPLGENILRP